MTCALVFESAQHVSHPIFRNCRHSLSLKKKKRLFQVLEQILTYVPALPSRNLRNTIASDDAPNPPSLATTTPTLKVSVSDIHARLSDGQELDHAFRVLCLTVIKQLLYFKVLQPLLLSVFLSQLYSCAYELVCMLVCLCFESLSL